MATTYNFTFDQGTTVLRTLAWSRKVGTASTPINLTGWSARMEVRTTYGGVLLYRLDPIFGNLVMGGAAGTMTITIPATVTAGWNWRSAVYDLEVIDPVGSVGRLIQGKIKILPEVTTGA